MGGGGAPGPTAAAAIGGRVVPPQVNTRIGEGWASSGNPFGSPGAQSLATMSLDGSNHDQNLEAASVSAPASAPASATASPSRPSQHTPQRRVRMSRVLPQALRPRDILTEFLAFLDGGESPPAQSSAVVSALTVPVTPLSSLKPVNENPYEEVENVDASAGASAGASATNPWEWSEYNAKQIADHLTRGGQSVQDSLISEIPEPKQSEVREELRKIYERRRIGLFPEGSENDEQYQLNNPPPSDGGGSSAAPNNSMASLATGGGGSSAPPVPSSLPLLPPPSSLPPPPLQLGRSKSFPGYLESSSRQVAVPVKGGAKRIAVQNDNPYTAAAPVMAVNSKAAASASSGVAAPAATGMASNSSAAPPRRTPRRRKRKSSRRTRKNTH